jgi:hypothetical protein
MFSTMCELCECASEKRAYTFAQVALNAKCRGSKSKLPRLEVAHPIDAKKRVRLRQRRSLLYPACYAEDFSGGFAEHRRVPAESDRAHFARDERVCGEAWRGRAECWRSALKISEWRWLELLRCAVLLPTGANVEAVC